ncbi:hypothetical protein ASG87_04695 [Frateuria sp. Soil773]|nr:hypothetical protein ASG87_04695 [Frateuria sp. Soil773]
MQRRAQAALRLAAAAWLGVALLGQLLFVVYVVGFYGRAAALGRPETWNRVLQHGYVAGETVFNLVLAVHLLFAVAIILGGALQLIPRVRRRAPAFHRWNGRAYLLAAAVLGIGGLAMVWIRGDVVGDLSQHLGISLNALLMLGFAAIAWRHARAGRLDRHRRWALRLFLAVNGVWFFRIGLMFWIVANQGPAGFDPKTFSGPFLTFLSFAQYAVPLGVLELYFLAQRRGTPRGQLAMAAGLGLLTLATLIGTGAAFAALWLPHLRA